MGNHVLLAFSLIGSSAAFAQKQPLPVGDAASIKPNNTSLIGGREGALQFSPGSVAGTNVTVRRII